MDTPFFVTTMNDNINEHIFVGREKEIDLMKDHFFIKNERVIEINGQYGIGKTALACKFKNDYYKEFPGGNYSFNASFNEPLSKLVLREVSNTQEPLLIIIDELGKLADSESGLTSELAVILKERPTANLILISFREAKIRIPHLTIFLNALNTAQLIELIKEYLKYNGIQNGALRLDDLLKIANFSKGNIVTTREALQYIYSNSNIDNFFSLMKPIDTYTILDANGDPLPPNSTGHSKIISDVKLVNSSFLEDLSKNPGLLYKLSPRKFEEVIAEILNRLGYRVELTPITRDGGKDILVAKKNDLGSFLYFVECKNFAPDNPVGLSIVQRLYGVVMAERATAGILATTSYFTKDAKKFQQQQSYQISLKDYVNIQEWLQKINV